MSNSLDSKLRSLLMLDWLRPERAIMKLFKTVSLENVEFKSPSLDLSCGDGSLMFLHFGGEFEDDFDHYLATRADEFSHDKFIDIYDIESNEQPPIRKRPDYVIDHGTDWKDGLLDKARHMGAHANLIRHDNNELPLPFDNESLATVFSNAVYWVDDVEGLMADIHRVLKPEGQIVLQLMTPHFLGTLDRLEGTLSERAINILDRNRRATMPGARTFAEWEAIVKEAGFSDITTETMFPSELLIDIWNVGFRPISHLLIQMANELDPVKRAKIKKEWVNIFHALLLPLVSAPVTCTIERSPYIQIVARK